MRITNWQCTLKKSILTIACSYKSRSDLPANQRSAKIHKQVRKLDIASVVTLRLTKILHILKRANTFGCCLFILIH